MTLQHSECGIIICHVFESILPVAVCMNFLYLNAINAAVMHR